MTTQAPAIDLRATVIDHLRAFAEGRPGLDFANYGDVSAYRSESRRITQQLADARTLLNAVEWREGITAEDLLQALKHAFSGRLSWVDNGQSLGLTYCTGQYFPTEFRAAVCSVLAASLWCYWRKDIPETEGNRGEYLRKKAGKEFGRGLANRWFR